MRILIPILIVAAITIISVLFIDLSNQYLIAGIIISALIIIALLIYLKKQIHNPNKFLPDTKYTYNPNK